MIVMNNTAKIQKYVKVEPVDWTILNIKWDQNEQWI